MSHIDKHTEWSMQANRILLALAYFDERRGMLPLGDLLPKLLDRKWEYVKSAELAEREGQPWTSQEFGELCFGGFEELIGTKGVTA
jgi:hypothetical protein